MGVPQRWWCYPICYLLVTAAAGAVLRGMALLPAWQGSYVPLLHAHSHLALLGWVYTALTLLLLNRFVPEEEHGSRTLRTNWILTQAAIAGMFVSFVLQGYGAFSIGFSTLHILLSYWLAAWMWRRLRKPSTRGVAHSVSAGFARASLLFMALSSVGPWSLAVLSAKGMSESPWYDAALYFYLHSQYNGWFACGLFAVLYSFIEDKLHGRAAALARLHYVVYVAAVLPSFLLSLLWMDLSPLLAVVAVASGAAQAFAIAAFFLLLSILLRQHPQERRQAFAGGPGLLALLSLASLAVKTLMELGSAVPALESLVFDNRSVVIGYLHLTLLGFVSAASLSFLLRLRFPEREEGNTAVVGSGIKLFAAGFLYNEVLLFLGGLLQWLRVGRIPYDSEQLFIASLLMLIGLCILAARILFAREAKKLATLKVTISPK